MLPHNPPMYTQPLQPNPALKKINPALKKHLATKQRTNKESQCTYYLHRISSMLKALEEKGSRVQDPLGGGI